VSDWQVRGRSFGAAATAYERFRPGYRGGLADLVLAGLRTQRGAGHGPIRALESGAGTGKATRVFLSAVLDLTVVEPDPQMRAVLREVVPLPPPPDRLTVVGSTLEDLAPEWRTPVYDLVYAAASWHWVDADTRWERAAALLRPGGVFASFGGPIEAEDAEVADAVERWWPDAPHIRLSPSSRRAAGADDTMSWPGNELVDSPDFTSVEQHALPVTDEWPAAAYVGLLSTLSDFQIISADERHERLRRIATLLPDPVRLRQDLVLHRAVRTSVPAAWPEA
jgi:SAM-dependent methyltransferase